MFASSIDGARAVLFDWDGTLADTAESSYRCYVKMFAELGMEFDRARYAETYSPNWHHTYRCMGLPENRWPEADASWLRHFAEEQTELIEGARELLESLQMPCGIVSSATRRRLERELERLRVDHHFAHVVCGDDGFQRKPHPEPLIKCLERLGVAPHEAVYIGDSPEDIAMARAAGVFSIAVPGTYPNTHALQQCGADLFLSSLSRVRERVARSAG